MYNYRYLLFFKIFYFFIFYRRTIKLIIKPDFWKTKNRSNKTKRFKINRNKKMKINNKKSLNKSKLHLLGKKTILHLITMN